MSDGTFLIHWDGLKSCVFIVSEKKCEKALARHVGRPSLGHTQTVEVETISVEVRCRLLARHLSHSKIQALLCVDKGDQRRCLRLTEDCKGMSGNLVCPYTMAISCYLLNHSHTHAHLVGHSGTSEAALQSLIPNHGMARSTFFSINAWHHQRHCYYSSCLQSSCLLTRLGVATTAIPRSTLLCPNKASRRSCIASET